MRMKEYATKRAAFLKLLSDTNGTEKRARKTGQMTRKEFTCNHIAKRNKVKREDCRAGYYNSFWQDNLNAGRIVMDNDIPRVTAEGSKYIRDNKV